MPPLRIGILGAARIAPTATLNPIKLNGDLTEKAVICSVAARSPEKAAQFAAEHGIPRTHASYEAMLADDEIDAVYCPLPNAYHAAVTIQALQAGKHCLCEKPFANNAAEAMAVQRASEDSGCIAVEAFHPLHHPVAKRARELVLGGAIGSLKHIDVQFLVNFSVPQFPSSRCCSLLLQPVQSAEPCE
jgi:predicted dehydrogenase